MLYWNVLVVWDYGCVGHSMLAGTDVKDQLPMRLYRNQLESHYCL